MDGHKEQAVPTHPQRLMRPENPRWAEFLERLQGPGGCDFKKDGNGEITWRCKGGKDKTLATAIMQSMSDVDVPASLAYFERHGGFCDCEIVLNTTVT
jgi:hypothetical protein